MSTFASQDLIIGTTPVGFDKTIINKKPLKQAAQAFFRIEGAAIRMNADPSKVVSAHNNGIPADVGQYIEIVEEVDIENFRAVVIDPTETAFISVQFTTRE